MKITRPNMEMLEVPEGTTEIPVGYEGILEVTGWIPAGYDRTDPKKPKPIELLPSRHGWKVARNGGGTLQRYERPHVRRTKVEYSAMVAGWYEQGIRKDVREVFNIQTVEGLYRKVLFLQAEGLIVPKSFKCAAAAAGWLENVDAGYWHLWSEKDLKGLQHYKGAILEAGRKKNIPVWDFRTNCSIGCNTYLDPIWDSPAYQRAQCCPTPRIRPWIEGCALCRHKSEEVYRDLYRSEKWNPPNFE